MEKRGKEIIHCPAMPTGRADNDKFILGLLIHQHTTWNTFKKNVRLEQLAGTIVKHSDPRL